MRRRHCVWRLCVAYRVERIFGHFFILLIVSEGTVYLSECLQGGFSTTLSTHRQMGRARSFVHISLPACREFPRTTMSEVHRSLLRAPPVVVIRLCSVHYNTLKQPKIYSYSDCWKIEKTPMIHHLLSSSVQRPTVKLGLVIALLLSQKSFILERT